MPVATPSARASCRGCGGASVCAGGATPARTCTVARLRSPVGQLGSLSAACTAPQRVTPLVMPAARSCSACSLLRTVTKAVRRAKLGTSPRLHAQDDHDGARARALRWGCCRCAVHMADGEMQMLAAEAAACSLLSALAHAGLVMLATDAAWRLARRRMQKRRRDCLSASFANVMPAAARAQPPPATAPRAGGCCVPPLGIVPARRCWGPTPILAGLLTARLACLAGWCRATNGAQTAPPLPPPSLPGACASRGWLRAALSARLATEGAAGRASALRALPLPLPQQCCRPHTALRVTTAQLAPLRALRARWHARRRLLATVVSRPHDARSAGGGYGLFPASDRAAGLTRTALLSAGLTQTVLPCAG